MNKLQTFEYQILCQIAGWAIMRIERKYPCDHGHVELLQ